MQFRGGGIWTDIADHTHQITPRRQGTHPPVMRVNSQIVVVGGVTPENHTHCVPFVWY